MHISTIALVTSLIFFSSISMAQNVVVPRIAYDFSQMYETYDASVVKVFTDGGTGSGFVVSDIGLVATNHHVVRNSKYLAVQFADGRKVKAEVVVLSPRYDIAVLKINPALLQGVRSLQLLTPDKETTVKPGVPVLAFGSPLSQTFLMTQGIISKVEDEVLLGDFLIQPGNSGGPLMNLDGEVVGINTFATGSISGAVRIARLRDILSNINTLIVDGIKVSADLLPTTNPRRYPTEVLKKKIIDEKLDLSSYRLDGGKFSVTAITPVLLGKLQVQADLEQA